jgi:hypothetical protein
MADLWVAHLTGHVSEDRDFSLHDAALIDVEMSSERTHSHVIA